MFAHIREYAKRQDISLRIINGVEDHLHCLFRLRPTQTYSNVVKLLKGECSNWLNKEYFSQEMGRSWFRNVIKRQQRLGMETYLNPDDPPEFRWQNGYGSISVSPPNVPSAIRYIFKQEEHHRHQSLEDELKMFEYHADEEEWPETRIGGVETPP